MKLELEVKESKNKDKTRNERKFKPSLFSKNTRAILFFNYIREDLLLLLL